MPAIGANAVGCWRRTLPILMGVRRTAYASLVSRAFLLGDALFVHLPHLLVLPFDQRLCAEMLQEFDFFRVHARAVHMLRDLVAHFVERLESRRVHYVDFEELIPARRSKRLCDVARLHFFDHVAKL